MVAFRQFVHGAIHSVHLVRFERLELVEPLGLH